MISALTLLARLQANPWPTALAYLVGMLALVALLGPATRRLAAHPRLTAAVVALAISFLAVADAALYPRSRTGPAPSTAPDAMAEPARNLVEGRFPYDVALRGGAPASPGVGWVLLNAPATIPGLAWALSPFWLAVAAVALGKGRPAAAAAFVALLLATLHFVRLSVVGHDLFPAACAMAAVTAAVYASRGRPWNLAGLALVAGIIATARAPFVIIPALLACLVARQDRRAGVLFGSISIATAAALHGTMLAWAAMAGGWYQPLHVFGRAARPSSGFLIAGALLWAVLGAAAVLRADSRLSSWLLALWVNFAIPFVTVGVAEFAANGWTLHHWEGATYVAFHLPLLAAALALRVTPSSDSGQTSA